MDKIELFVSTTNQDDVFLEEVDHKVFIFVKKDIINHFCDFMRYNNFIEILNLQIIKNLYKFDDRFNNYIIFSFLNKNLFDDPTFSYQKIIYEGFKKCKRIRKECEPWLTILNTMD